jgi:hypothetical protein
MNKDTYQDDLWDSIPTHAFMALGRRGQESIDLHQCFIPKCDSTDKSILHPLEKKVEQLPLDLDEMVKEKTSFTIYCEKCQKSFNLVFERTSYANPQSESTETSTKDIILERVYAEDSQTGTNFGDIGYVQYNTRKR